MRKRHVIPFSLALATILALPLPLVALTRVDEEYMACMLQAVTEREDALLGAAHTFSAEQLAAFEQRRNDVIVAWQAGDDRTARDLMRSAERNYRDAKRQIDRSIRETEREVKRQFRQRERDCREALRDRDREVRRREREDERLTRETWHSGTTQVMGESDTGGSGTPSVPPGTCLSSNDCGNGVCTIEYGDCRPACVPGTGYCIRVCGGVCVPQR